MRAATQLFHPLLQIALFALVIFMSVTDYAWSAIFAVAACAGVVMSFTLFIPLHELIHHPPFRSAPLRLLTGVTCSLLLGNSYTSFTLGHANHHRHSNGRDDCTSTWRFTGDGLQPRRALPYCLLWLRMTWTTGSWINGRIRRGSLSRAIGMQMILEYVVIAAALVALFLLDPMAGAGYLVMTYVGWAMIALHNYGQHLPVDPANDLVCFYPGRHYNLLMINNGHHHKHHHRPGLPWRRLVNDCPGRELTVPPPLAPLLGGKALRIRNQDLHGKSCQ